MGCKRQTQWHDLVDKINKANVTLLRFTVLIGLHIVESLTCFSSIAMISTNAFKLPNMSSCKALRRCLVGVFKGIKSHSDTPMSCAVYPAATTQYDNAQVNSGRNGFGKMMNYDK